MTLARDLARAISPELFAAECGLEHPDDWQSELLVTMPRRALLNCARQSGKSTVAGLLGLHQALFTPGALVLLVSPSQRQSAELHRSIMAAYRHLDGAAEIAAESVLRVEFANGSRIVALPGAEGTVRGYAGADTVILDEAARVGDDLLVAVRPMLATKDGGRLIALSTPFGRRGWFFEAWQKGEGWHKVKITADRCPRITADFLEEERRELGDTLYRQEYYCEFIDNDDVAFNTALIERAFTSEVRPLWQ